MLFQSTLIMIGQAQIQNTSIMKTPPMQLEIGTMTNCLLCTNLDFVCVVI